MKSFVLILATLMSFIFGDGGEGNACDININYSGSVAHCSGNDATEKKADFKDAAILPVRTATFSGDGNSIAPSLRTTNSGRRVQPSSKSSFRVIKTGKVFDRNNFYTFQTVILQFQSGIRSNSRYIYSICQLLI